MRPPIIDKYHRNVAEAEAQLRTVGRSITVNAMLRLMVIVAGGAGVFMAAQLTEVWAVLLLFIAITICFAGLVWRQSKLEAKRTGLQDLLSVNRNELDLYESKPNKYPDGGIYANAQHRYSADLDVFGPSSLYALVNRCATPGGNAVLAEWLSAPAGGDTIAARQEIAKELAADVSWHQQFQVRLWFNLHHAEDFRKQFARFVDNQEPLRGNTFTRQYVKMCPWLMGTAVGLTFFMPVFLVIAACLAAIHLLTAMALAGKVNRIAAHVSKAGQLLSAFAEAFALIEEKKWQSGLGQALSSTLCAGNGSKSVSLALKELAVLIDRLDYRLYMIIGALLNMVALWDFRQVFAISDWRERHGKTMLQAFDVVGQIEALGSLGALTRNYPHWVFPGISDTPRPFIEAKSIAHPLISAANAVRNDYHMEDHRVALITGSNMAGKSTFLRTVGSNAVLAFCGAPVCAAYMRLSVFHLVTYMRIADSLNESTSTFKAELNRIQLVLNTVKSRADTFFLIDEMLRGTNSVDKYLGSKAVIQQLITDGGVGMVATHDLQLAKLSDEHPGVLANYHFDIQVKDGEMIFDYKIKPGECTIFNASLLLKRIGINV